MLHVLQVTQRNPHQARVQHQLVLVLWSHGLRCWIEEEYTGVSCGHLVVADAGVAKATDHHFVAAVQEDFAVDAGLAFQVAPHADLLSKGQEQRKCL